MSSFEKKVEEATTGEKPQVLGVVALSVDRDGKTILSHASGKTSLKEDAKPIDKDSILVIASCTKLITSLAVLRLVQEGKLNLDDPSIISTHLPELCGLDVLTSAIGEDLKLEKRGKAITLRQLLTHSSGSSYDAQDPRLISWRAQRSEQPLAFAGNLPYAICTPSVFQPGEGWAYGGGLCWAGMLVERVTGRSLGDYMRKEIFDVVSCDSHVGFRGKELDPWVQTVKRGEDGKLINFPWPPSEQKSDRGSGGLYCSAENFVKILSDLISPSPRILSVETLRVLFSPQFPEGSKSLAALRTASGVFTAMTGALTGSLPPESLNHTLGGLLVTKDNPELGKSAGTMAWGGAFNCLWFANRETGVAGFYGSSMFPPGENKSSELMNSFVKEAWGRVAKS